MHFAHCGSFTEALVEVRAAVKIDPSDVLRVNYLLNQSIVLGMVGDEAEVREHMRIAMKMSGVDERILKTVEEIELALSRIAEVSCNLRQPLCVLPDVTAQPKGSL